MRAIQVTETGTSAVLRMAVVPEPEPGPSEALVQLEACGVNFIDVYQRSGLYPIPLPFILGQEGAGVVVALGPDSGELAIGDRVAFTSILGAYAEQIVVPVARLVAIPDALETPTAAAIMLQGLTAHYLVFDTYRLEPGSVCLVHAGAGGVGLLLIQLAKARGATVFTTVGTAAKAELAAAAGADHVIIYTESDFAAEVQAQAGEHSLDVVYDSVGVDTFDRSLELLRPRGLLALFGQSSGPIAPLDLSRLARGGSLYVTRPTLGSYIATREELERRSRDLFEWVTTGDLSVRIGSTYPLSEAAAAHDALEGRATTGKVLLLP